MYFLRHLISVVFSSKVSIRQYTNYTAISFMVSAECITRVVKVVIGRPRPNYIALCEFESLQAINVDDCATKGANYSFPSGHATLSMSAGTYFQSFPEPYFCFEVCFWHNFSCEYIIFINLNIATYFKN